MALPNLPSSITQKTGIQLIENGYSRLNDHVSNNYWTSNLLLKEADANTLVLYDAATGAIVKNIKMRGIRFVDNFIGVLAAVATLIRTGNTLAGATPVTFTIDAQPDVPRNLTYAFVSHAQITAYTLVFTGVDARGNIITDTFTQATGWTGATAQAYATVTSIILTARTGTGVADTCNVGVGSILGLSNDIVSTTDVYKVVKSSLAAGLAADYSGVGNITVATAKSTVDVSTGAGIVDGDKFTIYYLGMTGA
jgi:hypothetical protein